MQSTTQHVFRNARMLLAEMLIDMCTLQLTLQREDECVDVHFSPPNRQLTLLTINRGKLMLFEMPKTINLLPLTKMVRITVSNPWSPCRPFE